MMRYFFHICSPVGRSADEEGQDHADLTTAYRAAVAGLREIVSYGIRHGELRTAEWIEIEDGSGERLARVSFCHILEPVRPELFPAARRANDC